MSLGRAGARAAAALAMVVAGAAGTSAHAGDGAQRFGTVHPFQMPGRMQVRDAAVGDMDGDGLEDLVISARLSGEPFARLLRIHPRRAALRGFDPAPAAVVDLRAARDAVAFALGDVDPDPGDEILLFSARGLFAWRTGAAQGEELVRLAAIRFLWQAPDPREIFFWPDAVRDLDGDGLDDVVVPEPDGYRILLQDRGEGRASLGRSAFLRIPSRGGDDGVAAISRTGEGSVRVSLRLGADDAPGLEGPFLSVLDRLPVLQFLDFDADGDLDALLQDSRRLYVWQQGRGEGARWPEAPSETFPLPVKVDRSRILDISYSAHAVDLDRDGRADYVLLAGDQRDRGKKSGDRRTQVLIFAQGRGKGPTSQTPQAPLFGPRGIPQQLLVLAGFAGAPWFGDVDGDRLPDFVVGSIRFDLLDQVRAASNDTLETELYVYRNRGGRFSERPVLRKEVQLRVDELGKLGEKIVARFLGDLTGDGVSELLLRDRPERVRLFLTRRRGDSLEIADRPLAEFRVEDGAEIRILQPTAAVGGGGRGGRSVPELLVLEKHQLLHVTFP